MKVILLGDARGLWSQSRARFWRRRSAGVFLEDSQWLDLMYTYLAPRHAMQLPIIARSPASLWQEQAAEGRCAILQGERVVARVTPSWHGTQRFHDAPHQYAPNAVTCRANRVLPGASCAPRLGEKRTLLCSGAGMNSKISASWSQNMTTLTLRRSERIGDKACCLPMRRASYVTLRPLLPSKGPDTLKIMRTSPRDMCIV